MNSLVSAQALGEEPRSGDYRFIAADPVTPTPSDSGGESVPPTLVQNLKANSPTLGMPSDEERAIERIEAWAKKLILELPQVSANMLRSLTMFRNGFPIEARVLLLRKLVSALGERDLSLSQSNLSEVGKVLGFEDNRVLELNGKPALLFSDGRTGLVFLAQNTKFWALEAQQLEKIPTIEVSSGGKIRTSIGPFGSALTQRRNPSLTRDVPKAHLVRWDPVTPDGTLLEDFDLDPVDANTKIVFKSHRMGDSSKRLKLKKDDITRIRQDVGAGPEILVPVAKNSISAMTQFKDLSLCPNCKLRLKNGLVQLNNTDPTGLLKGRKEVGIGLTNGMVLEQQDSSTGGWWRAEVVYRTLLSATGEGATSDRSQAQIRLGVGQKLDSQTSIEAGLAHKMGSTTYVDRSTDPEVTHFGAKKSGDETAFLIRVRGVFERYPFENQIGKLLK